MGVKLGLSHTKEGAYDSLVGKAERKTSRRRPRRWMAGCGLDSSVSWWGL